MPNNDPRVLEVVRYSEPIDLDQVASKVSRLHHAHGLRFACELGRLLIDELFGGSSFDARRKLGTSTSLRELAARDDVPASLTTMSLSIRVTEQFDLLGQELSEQLTVSHHHELLRIRHLPTRRRLAGQAVTDGLSVRALRALVSEARPRAKGKRGRPARPPAVKLMDQLDRAIKVDSTLLDDLDDDRRTMVRERLQRHIHALNELMELL